MTITTNSNLDYLLKLYMNNTQVARSFSQDGPFYILTLNQVNTGLDGTLCLVGFRFSNYEEGYIEYTIFKELQRNEYSVDSYIIPSGIYNLWFSTAPVPDEPISPQDINLEEKQVTITENGITTVTPTLMEGYDALSSVEITTNVPSDVNNANVNTNSIITTNGTYSIPSGYTGFNNFEVALPMQQKIERFFINNNEYPSEDITFGRYIWYTPDNDYRGLSGVRTTVFLGYKTITTNGSYSIVDYRNDNMLLGWWKVDINVPQGEMIINALPGNNGVVTTNGQYNIPSGSTGFDSFTVNVPQTAVNNANVNSNSIITNNGTFSIPSGYTGFNNFEVAIPISNERIINYTIDDQSYPNTNTEVTVNTLYAVPSGYQGQGNLTVPVKLLYKSITSNGSYSIVNNRSANNELGYWKVDVNVPQETIQNSKTVNITRNTNQPLVLTPDSGYDALRQIELNVNVPNQTGVNPLEIYFVDSGVSNHPIYDYMYTRNTSGSYIYLEPSQYAELWIQKDNGDVEFVVYYYKGTGSRYPLTNSTYCYYQVSTPATTAPNPGNTVVFKDGVNGSNQLTINWYERYFSGTNMPGLLTASITFPSALIGSTIRLPFFDN